MRYVLPLALCAACHRSLPDGDLVEQTWLVPVSEVVARLEVPCAGALAEPGTFRVVVDDVSGTTALVEQGSDEVWLRDAFGVVPDRCWWLPELTGPHGELADQPCITGGRQDGSCDGDEQVDSGFVFTTPGWQVADGEVLDAVALDGTLLAWTGSHLAVLDLTPSARSEVEHPRSFHRWVDPLPAPGGARFDQVAVSAGALVAWDTGRGELWTFPVDTAREGLDGHHRSAPRDPGVLAAAGAYAAIATDRRVHVFRDLDRPRRSRRDHPLLGEGVVDLVVHPDTSDTWVLVPDGVLGLPASGPPTWHQAPGAQGLLLGRPGDEPTPYAWGTDGESGVVYRLDPDGTTRALTLDQPLLGAGIGDLFQELVLVTAGEDGVVRATGWLDLAHLDALPAGSVGLALAAFAERPRDEALHDEALALDAATAREVCEGLEADELICCVQAARGDLLAHNLDWLALRLDPGWPGGPAAVVLGINPTTIEQSSWCDRRPGLASDGAVLPEALGELLLEWPEQVAPAVLIHSKPFDEDSWWVACPGVPRDEADASCWDLEQTPANHAAFYEALVQRAALDPWVDEEVDWLFLGGGYEGANQQQAGSWLTAFPDLLLPDGEPADLYFGLAGMDSRVGALAAKELAPVDATLRPYPVHHPIPDSDATARYWPGQTFAATWLWERRRAGLLFGDFDEWADEHADWTTDQFPGDETAFSINRADLALEEHYLISRVVAHREAAKPKWWYVHLQDLSNLRSGALDDGLVDGNTPTDTELDRFLRRIEAWGPALAWRPTP